MQGTQYHNGIPFQATTPKKVWRKIRKTVVVDSRDRQFTPQSSPGEYVVTLPAVYQNVYSATLKSIEVPFSFYTFSACAGNTSIQVEPAGSSEPTTVTIPDGNYTSSDLASVLQTALGGAYTCTYSSTTGRLTIANTSPFDLVFNENDPSNTNCGKATNFSYNTWQNLAYYLGFSQERKSSTPDGGGRYLIVGDFAMNPAPSTYFLMELGPLNKIDETSLDNKKSGRINGAFAKIPVNVNSGDYIFIQDTGTSPLNYRVYNPPIGKLSQLYVKFRYHDGRVIDFNGIEHSFTLEFELLDNNFDEYSGAEFSQF